MKTMFVSVLAGLAMSSAALAQHTETAAGPFISDGGAGGSGNGVWSFNYAGPSFAAANFVFEGDVTSGGVGSFLSELRLRVINPQGQIFDSGSIAAGSTWSGTVHIGPVGAPGSSSNPVGMWQVRFWESFDDSGIDATWTNLRLTMNVANPPSNCIDLGDFNSISQFQTDGAFDTEIGLYDSSGNLLGSSDDEGPGLGSQLDFFGGLAQGSYYLAVTGYNASFSSLWSVTPGSASGQINLSVDGGLVDSRAHGSGTVTWYCVDVVPAPSSLALIGLGGLIAGRRRR